MIRRLLKSLGTALTPAADEKLGRAWEYRPSIEINRNHVALNLELVLVKLYGKPTAMIARYAYLQFRFRPSAWRLGTEHVYYDGEHCSWMLGPLQLHQQGFRSCERCREGK